MFNVDINRASRIGKAAVLNSISPQASIFNNQRDPDKTTFKYVELDDLVVVEALNELGWKIVKYNEVKPHNKDRQGLQTYCATYENTNYDLTTTQGRARLLQIGSHDGRSKLRLEGGFFTFACANGLIIGNSVCEPVAIKHFGEQALQVDKAVSHFLDRMPVLFDKIGHMVYTNLSESQKHDFALDSIRLRFEDTSRIRYHEVLVPRYKEQSSNSVWDVFNTIQTNLIENPNIKALTPTKDKFRKLRKVTNIEANVNLNRDLWNLAESFIH